MTSPQTSLWAERPASLSASPDFGGGLADPRGNLALVYLALADRYRPEWLVWENVPGVLSSNGGRDFGAFLGGLVKLGYGFAYRVLDAQYFGVAQRRRRVFVVANSRDWRRAAAVLFERHGLSGHPAPRRETGEGIAPTLAARTRGGGGLGTDLDCDGGLIPRWPADIACTLNAAFGSKQGLEDQHALGGGNCSSLPEVSLCLNAGAMGRLDAESETLIPTFGGGFDDVAPTLQAGGNTTGGSRPPGTTVDTCESLIPVTTHTLRADGFDASEDGTGRGTPLVPVPIQNATRGKSQNGLGIGGDVMFTLDQASQHAIAFAQSQRDEVRTMEVAGALAAEPGAKQQTYMQQGMAVRRLTPVECERLQGFEDGYTLIPWRGKPAEACPDGPRYKALGNSMAVPVMAWIGRRIAAVNAQASALSTPPAREAA